MGLFAFASVMAGAVIRIICGGKVSLYDDAYDGKEPYWPNYGPSDYLDERELRRLRARYSGEATMAERWLGHFLDKMEELELFNNTQTAFERVIPNLIDPRSKCAPSN